MRRYSKAVRLIALALVIVTLALSMSALAMGTGVSFSDVSSSAWYYSYVQKCSMLDIINGYDDGTFRPDQALKRGEFIKMLACSLEGSYSTGAHGRSLGGILLEHPQ